MKNEEFCRAGAESAKSILQVSESREESFCLCRAGAEKNTFYLCRAGAESAKPMENIFATEYS